MIEGLCERLSRLRMERRLTQKEVAAALKVSPSSISHYENGEVDPPLIVVVKMASLYRCSIDYLVTGRSVQGDVRMIDVSMLDESQCKLLEALVRNMIKRDNNI